MSEESAPQPLTLTEQIEANVMPATWQLLKPHAERGGLFLVEKAVPLVDAATAVAEDNTQQVGQWFEAGSLRRPSDAEIVHWEEHSGAFVAIIVQPYVLATAITDE